MRGSILKNFIEKASRTVGTHEASIPEYVAMTRIKLSLAKRRFAVALWTLNVGMNIPHSGENAMLITLPVFHPQRNTTKTC